MAKTGKKLAKTQMTKTVGFMVNICLKCINVCLDGIGAYCALCLMDFLVGDYLKCAYVTVHMETHAVCKWPSPFANCLKSEPVCQRPRQYENREGARLRQYESRKAACLRAGMGCK